MTKHPKKRKTPPKSSSSSFRRLFDIARQLTGAAELDTVLRHVSQSAQRLMHAEAASVLLLDEEGQHLVFKAATGRNGSEVLPFKIPVEKGVAGYVARTGEVVRLNQARRDPRFMSDVDSATHFATRSLLAVPLTVGGVRVGVLEVLNKIGSPTFSQGDTRLAMDLAGLAAAALAQARAADQQRNFFTHGVDIFITAVERRDPRSEGHARRAATLALQLGRRLGLQDRELDTLHLGALLHDLGYIAMEHRPGVSMNEAQSHRLHTVLGHELLKNVRLMKPILPIIRHHHERWDGTGHPDGLAGEAIPLSARILGLVEEVEELQCSGLPETDLPVLQRQLALNGSDTWFDPRVVEAYLALTSPWAKAA